MIKLDVKEVKQTIIWKGGVELKRCSTPWCSQIIAIIRIRRTLGLGLILAHDSTAVGT